MRSATRCSSSGSIGFGCSRYWNDAYVTNDLWQFNFTTGYWTWISGDGSKAVAGTYGTMGVESSANVPGARCASAIVYFNSSVYLFGGATTFDIETQRNAFNDLWRFNLHTRRWAWLNGSAVLAQPGVYGTPGMPMYSNQPGSRRSVGLTVNPASGSIYLFGGYGLDAAGQLGII